MFILFSSVLSITVLRLQPCLPTNFFHHWLNQINLHMLEIDCCFRNTLLWWKTQCVFALWFPFGLTSPSHLSWFIFQSDTYLQNTFTVSGRSHLISLRKISPQVKVLYQKSKSFTCRNYRSAWELMIAGLVIHTGELKPFYHCPFQSKLPLKAWQKKKEGHTIRLFAKFQHRSSKVFLARKQYRSWGHMES